jgi:hypothetical protein
MPETSVWPDEPLLPLELLLLPLPLLLLLFLRFALPLV